MSRTSYRIVYAGFGLCAGLAAAWGTYWLINWTSPSLPDLAASMAFWGVIAALIGNRLWTDKLVLQERTEALTKEDRMSLNTGPQSGDSELPASPGSRQGLARGVLPRGSCGEPD